MNIESACSECCAWNRLFFYLILRFSEEFHYVSFAFENNATHIHYIVGEHPYEIPLTGNVVNLRKITTVFGFEGTFGIYA